MALLNPDEFWKELDATGEGEVRKKYAAGAYGAWKHDLVDGWLSKQATDAAQAKEAIHTEVARRSMFWTKVGSIAALAAVIVACLGLWISRK